MSHVLVALLVAQLTVASPPVPQVDAMACVGAPTACRAAAEGGVLIERAIADVTEAHYQGCMTKLAATRSPTVAAALAATRPRPEPEADGPSITVTPGRVLVAVGVVAMVAAIFYGIGRAGSGQPPATVVVAGGAQ